jgi:hypothetical protein
MSGFLRGSVAAIAKLQRTIGTLLARGQHRTLYKYKYTATAQPKAGKSGVLLNRMRITSSSATLCLRKVDKFLAKRTNASAPAAERKQPEIFYHVLSRLRSRSA